MYARDFCYWLQGFFEISESTEITPKQLATIKNHLNLVFHHDLEPPNMDSSFIPQLRTPPPVNGLYSNQVLKRRKNGLHG